LAESIKNQHSEIIFLFRIADGRLITGNRPGYLLIDETTPETVKVVDFAPGK